MKSFKTHINEEWVDDSPAFGTVFKNPTPRELAEYINQIDYQYDAAGVLDVKKNDLYLFKGALHANFMQKYKINPTWAVLFRAVVRERKIIKLAPSGDMSHNYNMRLKTDRKAFLDDMIKVYSHKSIQSHIEKDPKRALSLIGIEFAGDKDEYVEMMKSTFGNKALGLKEEWVDNSTAFGDIYKNPSRKEVVEYMKESPYDEVIGVAYKDGTTYIWQQGFHENFLRVMNLPAKDAYKFRCQLKGRKIINIGPSGGDDIIPNPGPGDIEREFRKRNFDGLVSRVYNNKYLSPFMAPVKEAFADVEYSYNFAYGPRATHLKAEWEELLKKHKLKW